MAVRTLVWVKRNWDFIAETIAVIALAVLYVADRFGKVTLDSTWVGGTIVGLLYLASIRLMRQGKALDGVRQDLRIDREIRQVSGDRVGDELDQLLAVSDRWHFRGGSARWQLRRVLPHLAKQRDRSPRYAMQIIDPLDEQLCTRYGEYRALSRTGTDVPSLVEGPIEVRRNLLAGIYAAGWYKKRSQVRPEVTLLKSYSSLRFDIGTGGLAVTIANKAAPALFASEKSWYYRSVLDELEQLAKVSAQLMLPDDLQFYPAAIQEVRAEHVSQMLQNVQVRHPDGSTGDFEIDGCNPPLADDDFQAIAAQIRGESE